MLRIIALQLHYNCIGGRRGVIWVGGSFWGRSGVIWGLSGGNMGVVRGSSDYNGQHFEKFSTPAKSLGRHIFVCFRGFCKIGQNSCAKIKKKYKCPIALYPSGHAFIPPPSPRAIPSGGVRQVGFLGRLYLHEHFSKRHLMGRIIEQYSKRLDMNDPIHHILGTD